MREQCSEETRFIVLPVISLNSGGHLIRQLCCMSNIVMLCYKTMCFITVYQLTLNVYVL